MINQEIKSLIIEATKAHDTDRKEALKDILKEFQNFVTSTEGNKYQIDTIPVGDVMKILNKLSKQYKDTEEQCKVVLDTTNIPEQKENAERNIQEARVRGDVIREFIPTYDKADIAVTLFDLFTSGDPNLTQEKKNMKFLIQKLKELFPSADGKDIALVVKEHLG